MATRYSVEEIEEPAEEKAAAEPHKAHPAKKEEPAQDEPIEIVEAEPTQKESPEAIEKPFWTSDEEKNGFEHTPQENNEDMESPKIKEIESGGSKNWIWILLIVLGLLLIAGGAFWYFQIRNNSQEEISATPLEVATTPPYGGGGPTPTPQAAVTEAPDYSEYKAHVLNGSGISGEAGKVQAILEDLGVTSIETGNAKSFTYAKTQIQTKKDIDKAVVDGVEEALSKKYKVDVTGPLEENNKYDFVIIIGKEKVE